jgi:hypothetical protein
MRNTYINVGRFTALLIAITTSFHGVEAKLTKYWVVKSWHKSGSPQYYAYTSQKSCLNEVRRLERAFAKNIKANEYEVKCLDRIPPGYARPSG